MKILFWCDTFYPAIGGSEVLSAQLVRALYERGHAMLILGGPALPGKPDPQTFEGMPLYRFPFAYVHQPYSVELVAGIKRQFAALKRTFQPDVVHIFQTHTSFLLRIQATEGDPAPTLLTLHGTLPDWKPTTGPLRRLFQQVDWVSACSQAALAQARSLAPEIAAKSSAIRNAVVPLTLEPTPLSWDAPRLLCLGRLHPQKGFDCALDAFARVRRRFGRARLVIAGDGQARAELERQAAQLGILDATEFLGWVSPHGVPALLNTATLVLVPSRWEPFGLVALEAAHMARPVIASRVDGLPEVVREGETGLLVEPENPAALADAIECLLANPARAVALGNAARTHAQRAFDWERFVDEYEELYRRIAEIGNEKLERRECAG